MARWLVSDGTYARQADVAKVAVGGVVKPILRAVVAHEGIVRQFFPTAAPVQPSDERITWTTDPLTVTESVNSPSDSIASIDFSRATGAYTYKNHPSADGTGIYINPPVGLVPNIYIIKVVQVSGTPVTGTLNTWIDLGVAPNYIWSLDQIGAGSSTAEVDISIAEDTGATSPVTGTTVTKRVTFSSTVVSSSLVAWTTVQRDLVETKEAQDADCIMTFNPSGFATGDADTSGSFSENWHVNSPNATFQSGFTVNATLVSGTAPTGSDLGSDLTLDATRTWTLLATEGEDLTCALDVTVSDGVSPVTKRVTMTSTYTAPDSTNVWTATPSWVLNDNSEGGTAGVDIAIKADGTVEGTADNLIINYNEDWHSEAPTPSDPENYEGQLKLISGDASGVTGVLDTWFTLPNIVWSMEESVDELSVWTFDIMIRRIGGATVSKRVTVILTVE